MSIGLRDAIPLDAGQVGTILWRFQEGTAWMPKLHSAAETICFCGWMIDEGLVRVALLDGRIAGFLSRRGENVLSLYVAEDVQRQGLGAMLLADAQARAARLSLWTFQANAGAQRFYLRHGFAELRRTDGADNDEKLPDIEFQWERAV